MLDLIRRLFEGDAGGAPAHGVAPEEQALRVATCALLLEIAHADDTFSEAERRHVEEVLVRRFGVANDEARALMALAEERRREAVDLHGFTRVLTRRYGDAERLALATELWRVVYADGDLSRHEDHLLRQLAKLLDLPPGALNAARREALGGAAGA